MCKICKRFDHTSVSQTNSNKSSSSNSSTVDKSTKDYSKANQMWLQAKAKYSNTSTGGYPGMKYSQSSSSNSNTITTSSVSGLSNRSATTNIDDDKPTNVYNKNPPLSSSLSPWTTNDWTKPTGITVNVTDKAYIYDSQLALGGGSGKIFGPDYVAHHDSTTFDASMSGSGPGVPGPFDYGLPYSKWGGDDTLVGKQNYSQILGHFGHTHILTLHAKAEILRRDPSATTKVQDMMLEHLLNASTQIFAWYAQLVDNDGKFIDLSQEHPLVAQLKGMMGMLIYGWNTPGNNGHVDIAALAGGMNGFITQYAQSASHAAVLTVELNRLQAFLTDVLKLDTSNPRPLIAWQQLMRHHQDGSHECFKKYLFVYRTNKNDSDYQAKKAEADAFIKNNQEMGYQLAAFFGAFYSLTNFLDKLYIPQLAGDEYAIPTDIADANINYILAAQKRYWYEHTVIFSDYNKAAALNDEDKMYRISVWFLESCSFIASTVGEIFYRFDRLVRGRGIYQVLAQFPTQ